MKFCARYDTPTSSIAFLQWYISAYIIQNPGCSFTRKDRLTISSMHAVICSTFKPTWCHQQPSARFQSSPTATPQLAAPKRARQVLSDRAIAAPLRGRCLRLTVLRLSNQLACWSRKMLVRLFWLGIDQSNHRPACWSVIMIGRLASIGSIAGHHDQVTRS